MRTGIVATVILTFLAMPVMAHEAPKHDQQKLVPIPAHTLPYGEASGKAALRAVKALLNTFDQKTQSQIVFELQSETRAKWSNLPAGIVKRRGISIGQMTDKQRALLFAFLASSLGEEGYQSVAEVIAAEAFLSADKGAARVQWAPENYWLTVYGTPDENKPWGWQFGGHHLGLNIAVDGNRVTSMSPSFIGTEPAVFTVAGIEYEAMRDMHLSGYAVFSALNESRQQAADAGDVPEDLATGAGEDGIVPPVIGMSAASMSPDQQALLLAAINEWVSIQPDENAELRMAELTAGIGSISFAWTGRDDINTPTYMRIQGPTLIIELLSTGVTRASSAKGKGHYHSIYRNPTNEYGLR